MGEENSICSKRASSVRGRRNRHQRCVRANIRSRNTVRNHGCRGFMKFSKFRRVPKPRPIVSSLAQDRRGLAPPPHLQLLETVVHGVLHGCSADFKLPRDVLVGKPPVYMGDDIALASCQIRWRSGLPCCPDDRGKAFEQGSCHTRRTDDFAADGIRRLQRDLLSIRRVKQTRQSPLPRMCRLLLFRPRRMQRS